MRPLTALVALPLLSACMAQMPVIEAASGTPAPEARLSTMSLVATPEPEAVRALTPVFAGGLRSALNDARASAGLEGLSPHPRLADAAEAHARDMARQGYFSHRGLDGSTAQARAREQGCSGGYIAENIAWGQPSEQSVFTGWMASPAHHRNMMGRPYGVYGLGESGGMWVMMFADRC